MLGGVTDPPPMYLGDMDDNCCCCCCCCWVYLGEIEYLGEVVGVLEAGAEVVVVEELVEEAAPTPEEEL